MATTQDVNAPTPSFVLATALDFVRQLELAEQDASGHLDYQNVMAPDLQTFCHMAKLPAAPNALSDAGYMFTLSGADLIRDIYAYCSELAGTATSLTRLKSNRDMSSSWFLGCS